MRVPISWLRELVRVETPVDELALRLSTTGTAVDTIDRLEPKVSGVVVASVLEVGPVAESEKLCLAQVDAGPYGTFQVVAGARNFRAGDKIAFAKPGSRIAGTEIGVRTMAGKYESQGMLCSADELGIPSERIPWIVLLPRTAEPGDDVVRVLALDDAVLDLEIYPNRPDLLSMVGVAREVSLLYDVELRYPDASVVEDGTWAEELTSVTVSDADGCPRYLARIITGVTFAPSPALAQARLGAAGLRPLGNLVDATNYVLQLTGQPLHAFDLTKLEEGRIVVRRARAGERLRTIDGSDLALDPDDLVIADATTPQAVAGVMGGGSSEVGAGTERVLLEAAYFKPERISDTARRHGFRTEASARFERGTDPEAVPAAAAICAEIMRSWANGRVAKGVVDVGRAPERRTVEMRTERARLVLGADVGTGDAERQLAGLGCGVSAANGRITAVVPSWRPDLEREIDLIEELARLYGYDNIPSSTPTGPRGFLTRSQLGRRRVRDVLLGAGLSEAVLTSFISDTELGWIGRPATVEVTNPMTVDQGRLRPSLLPGLLRAAAHNTAQGVASVRLFEIGTVFGAWAPDALLPEEDLRVGIVVSGHEYAEAWHTPGRPVDAYDAKGAVDLILTELGITDRRLGPCDDEPFHPGRSASVVSDGAELGRFGEVRPMLRRALDVSGGLAVAELSLPALLARARDKLRVTELPRFPSTTRDISLVVDDDVAALRVRDLIESAGGEHLESVSVLDVYRGGPIAEGRKNLVFRLTLRSPDRTLMRAEADEVRERVVASVVGELAAEIR